MTSKSAAREAEIARIKQEEEEEEEEDGPAQKRLRQQAHAAEQCPYLDTINRNVLDFDFEKLCSVSLSRTNVYACLVCGKYFQVIN